MGFKDFLAVWRRERPIVFLPAPNKDNGRTVVVVHGLFMHAWFMVYLGRKFQQQGFEVYLYSYPTTRQTLEESISGYRDFLIALDQSLPAGRKVDIVAHSLGGLLNRGALGLLEEEGRLPGRFCHLLMLGTPNNGSKLADFWDRVLPFGHRLVHTLRDLRYGELGMGCKLPVPRGVRIGVIAARFDRCVSLASTHVQGEIAHIVVPMGHNMLLYSRKVSELAGFFLLHDRFSD